MAPVTLEQVYKEYFPKIVLLVRRKIADSSEVEDFSQDIFLKIAQNLDRYDPDKGTMSTWIYTVANRMILDYYRTRKVFVEIPDENGETGVLPDQLVDHQTLDSNILKEEQLQALADALGELNQRERDLIILHYYKNVTLKEVANMMEMSYANVKIIHRKAIRKLNLLMQA